MGYFLDSLSGTLLLSMKEDQEEKNRLKRCNNNILLWWSKLWISGRAESLGRDVTQNGTSTRIYSLFHINMSKYS